MKTFFTRIAVIGAFLLVGIGLQYFLWSALGLYDWSNFMEWTSTFQWCTQAIYFITLVGCGMVVDVD